MAASKMTMVNAPDRLSPPVKEPEENVTALLSRLGDDVTQFFDTKVALLKVEVREEVNTFLHASVIIAAGAVLAAIGFALLNVAVALGISALFANTNLSQAAKYALGFVITGVLYLIIGSATAMTMKSRLAKQQLVPRATVEELRKDKTWLKKEF